MQDTHSEDKVGIVHNRWLADTTATCQVCTPKVCPEFTQIVMTSIANSGLNVNGLHEHIVKDEVVSLKFTKVPGKLVVEEAKDNILLW